MNLGPGEGYVEALVYKTSKKPTAPKAVAVVPCNFALIQADIFPKCPQPEENWRAPLRVEFKAWHMDMYT